MIKLLTILFPLFTNAQVNNMTELQTINPSTDTIFTTSIVNIPPKGNPTVVRGIKYIVKRSDGWYDNTGIKRDVILYKQEDKWVMF